MTANTALPSCPVCGETITCPSCGASTQATTQPTPESADETEEQMLKWLGNFATKWREQHRRDTGQLAVNRLTHQFVIDALAAYAAPLREEIARLKREIAEAQADVLRYKDTADNYLSHVGAACNDARLQEARAESAEQALAAERERVEKLEAAANSILALTWEHGLENRVETDYERALVTLHAALAAPVQAGGEL